MTEGLIPRWVTCNIQLGGAERVDHVEVSSNKKGVDVAKDSGDSMRS